MSAPARDSKSADTPQLALRLAQAFTTGAAIARLEAALVPADADGAYAVQDRLLQLLGGRAGGWKVGAKSPTGPIQGAPLPVQGLLASGAMVDRQAFTCIGIELEIAFRFGRHFAPAHRPYSEGEVIGALAGVCAAIEVVSSRFAAWPEVDRLLQLADLQNHGALIVGEFTDYRDDFPFAAPDVQFNFSGADITPKPAANPAGDPRRLLAWVVNHCTMRGRAFEVGTIVTTGTYTGMYRVSGAGIARGEIAGLAPVLLRLD